MADEKLNTGPGEQNTPPAPDPVTVEQPQAPAPEQAAAPQPEQSGPAQPEAGDVVALTFNAPYLYQNAKGDYVRTNSTEEWKAAGGADANMRAVVACDELPQGWTVYTEHMGQYQERTAKELKRGLSGTIVLRYEGAQDKNGITERATRGRLDAATPLPMLTCLLYTSDAADD